MYENKLLSMLTGAGIGGGSGAIMGNTGRGLGGWLGGMLDAPRAASANFIEGLGDPLSMLQDQSYTTPMHVPHSYEKLDNRGFLEQPATGEDWDVSTSGPSGFARMLPGGAGLGAAAIAALAGLGPAALPVGAGIAGLTQLLFGPEAPQGENPLIDMLIDPSLYAGAGLGAGLGPKVLKPASTAKLADLLPAPPSAPPFLPVPEGRLGAIKSLRSGMGGLDDVSAGASPFSAGGGLPGPPPMPTGPQMFGTTTPLAPMDPQLMTRQLMTPTQMPGEEEVFRFLESMRQAPPQLPMVPEAYAAYTPESMGGAADIFQMLADKRRMLFNPRSQQAYLRNPMAALDNPEVYSQPLAGAWAGGAM